jgi:hypothetical protein
MNEKGGWMRLVTMNDKGGWMCLVTMNDKGGWMRLFFVFLNYNNNY